MATRLGPGSPALLRRLNAGLVLRTIRGQGPMSRAEIAQATGLSKPTVNEVAELLLREGYVLETLADEGLRPRRPGRRARLLRFRADLGYVLGIDIGANKILASAADLSGEILASGRRRTQEPEQPGHETLLDEVRAACDAALAAAGISRESLKAVGVGTPGVVDPASGQVRLAPQLAGWEGIELGKQLGRFLPCPVLVDNEVHLAVLAERWRGGAREIDDALYVQIGVGNGGGILIGGRLYRGANGAAGEIGYLPLGVDHEQPPGGLGPFERAAGGRAFSKLGQEAASGPHGQRLLELAGGDPQAVDAEIVFAAARERDPAAEAIVTELVGRLARGIAAAVAVLNPGTVIIGGGVSRAGAALLEPLEQGVRRLVPLPPRLVLSTLGDEAVALGAVRLALQEVDERLMTFSSLEIAVP